MRKGTWNLSAFTLIELLVVIAIIGILAAILMPALGRARQLAQEKTCLSNLHNIGMALQIYTQQSADYFPSCYSYVNGMGSSKASGDGNTGGYYHWTAAINYSQYTDPVSAGTYPKTDAQYVCPSHVPHGFAPSCFTSARIPTGPLGQVSQDATIDDKQAPRLSYLPNEGIMPRKKLCDTYDQTYSAAQGFGVGKLPDGVNPNINTSQLCLVNVNEIDNPANTILLAEFSQSAQCIYGSSGTGNATFKSHRPTNAFWVDQTYSDAFTKDQAGATGWSSNVFDGEVYPLFQTTNPSKSHIFKLKSADAYKAIDDVMNQGADAVHNSHITYMGPDNHNGGSNYYFVDGHASKLPLGATLDPTNWMWGKKVYSCVDKPLVRDNTTN